MTRDLIPFAAGCYHGSFRSTTIMLQLGTARESVVTLSLSQHVKLRDNRRLNCMPKVDTTPEAILEAERIDIVSDLLA